MKTQEALELTAKVLAIGQECVIVASVCSVLQIFSLLAMAVCGRSAKVKTMDTASPTADRLEFGIVYKTPEGQATCLKLAWACALRMCCTDLRWSWHVGSGFQCKQGRWTENSGEVPHAEGASQPNWLSCFAAFFQVPLRPKKISQGAKLGRRKKADRGRRDQQAHG